MGCTHVYLHSREDEAVHAMYGLPLAPLFGETNIGDGAVFEVTVKLLRKGRQRKNPWK